MTTDSTHNPSETLLHDESISANTASASTPASDEPQQAESIKNHSLGSMYKNWFLDYASYVILERAVPHIEDGLKPVQRRILYAMYLMENGMMHKVAKIVGATMAYHPHGDASINDALVQLGQKDFLIETQGNWGNIYTGDAAAAGRYIEAKLSNFALDILFGDKVTPWKKSYDGKADEPIYIPTRFPLLLAQGAEGIAVGLSSKILPHNPAELLNAACDYLQGKPFELYPDFPTGGLVDVERYNDGQRGGSVKSRAKIERLEGRTLSIKGLPFGKTTSTLIDSIIKANEKGKIKIKKIDDMTAEEADIRISLPTGVSVDKTIDGLYAFTDCEVNIWPNACVIQDDKPQFLSVSDLLRFSVDHTKELLRQELQIALEEKQEQFLAASLEQLFIVHRLYKEKEFEQAANETAVLQHLRSRLEPLTEGKLLRPIKTDDLKKLLEIRMARILKFNLAKHEEAMLKMQQEMDRIEKDLSQLVQYTINYYQQILKTYGAFWQRRTEIARFGTIEAAKVVETNLKFYIDRAGGFVGTSLKDEEYLFDCSEIDEFIIFFRNGTYMVCKVEDKKFIGKEEVIHVDRYIRGDKRTIYNVIYRHGKAGPYHMKRFYVASIIRDRVYDVTQGASGSRILYFTANPNGEAEEVTYKYALLNGAIREGKVDFALMAIKNRNSKGNIVSRRKISKVTLYRKGGTTLGGRKVWFDKDVNRINYDDQGTLLGEFDHDDRILVVRTNGEVYTCGFEESHHFEGTPMVIEKYDPNKVWSIAYLHPERQQPYLKRCTIPEDANPQYIAGEETPIYLLTDKPNPTLEIVFGGADDYRPSEQVIAEDFIAVKSINAKGKRLSTYEVQSVKLISYDEPQPTEKSSNSSNESSSESENDSSTPADQSATQPKVAADTPQEKPRTIEIPQIDTEAEGNKTLF